MVPNRKAMLEYITRASKDGWGQFVQALQTDADNSIVAAKLQVTYEPLGHDIVLDASVSVAAPEDVILQVWLKDLHPGIWIPEFRPWIASVVEFSPIQAIKQVHLGLIDSKWRKEDAGVTYHALLWGYVQRDGSTLKFALEQDFVFPG
jgi:hypothetical protein